MLGRESRFNPDKGRDPRFTKQNLNQQGQGQGPLGPTAHSSVIFDAIGRALREGDAVTLSMRGPAIFRVMKILPVLDPAAPAGTMQLQLVCVAHYMPKGGQSLGEVLRIGTVDELGAFGLELVEVMEVERQEAGASDDAGESNESAEPSGTAAGPRLVEN